MQSIVHRLTTACRGQLSCLVSVTTVPRYLKRIGGARKESMRLVPGSQLSSPSRPSRHSLGQQGTSKQSELKMALQGVLRGRVTHGGPHGLAGERESIRGVHISWIPGRSANVAKPQPSLPARAAASTAPHSTARISTNRALGHCAAPRSMTDSDQHTTRVVLGVADC